MTPSLLCIRNASYDAPKAHLCSTHGTFLRFMPLVLTEHVLRISRRLNTLKILVELPTVRTFDTFSAMTLAYLYS